MAWKIQNVLNLEVVAGKAQPTPPLGPMLWANWVNIGQFIKEFNDKTSENMKQFAWADVKMRVKVTIYADRTFELKINSPVTSNLILWKAGQKKWSGEPNKTKIWKITKADLEAIAELKKDDTNTINKESLMKAIAWTARNMWIEVVA